jgi:hypothetical protein
MLPLQRLTQFSLSPLSRGSATFRVLIGRFVCCHELVAGSVEWLAKPVYARQDRVMAVHSGTREALDS